ncbi:hypothetical protein DMN91_003685 [Ooceraea biroi]|uniref:Neuropeptides capa receptor n=1 Tax=Ooceraea biroi TaxID=2015173 RepID=A0A026W3I9_OOCBI|nr:pyrokinin-1 receptor [Ooceraea biroi]EZA50650.1 Neuropeptides capa receptor [Ooceraea biroi]RLU23480.1 hypothetical protein DMN91_003685 [Ooceraea biroi]
MQSDRMVITMVALILSNSTYPTIIGHDDSSLLPFEHHLNDTYADEIEHEAAMSPGSYRDPLYVVIPVTVMYASIFITGIVGNISTCIVITRNKSMHTATNYYLFSLAVSDLLLLVSGLPPEMYLVWCKYPYIFGEGFCVLRGLASETSTNASVLTIVAFTVERYVAICHLFLSQTLSNLSRAIKLILVIWLVALLFALPQALQFGVVRHSGHPDMVMCTVKRVIVNHSFELSTFLFFVIPMFLITFLYVLIGLKLRRSNMMNPGRTESMRNCRRHPGRSSRRVLKMLMAVVIAFFICWLPFHIQRLIAIYGTNKEDHITSNGPWMEFIYLLMTYVSGIFYYASTTINPILYNIMSNKFRMAFMDTLSRSCRLPGLPTHHEQRSYSSLSRSQQRTIGAYGSRTVGGSGMIADSVEGSGNSTEENQKQPTSNPEGAREEPARETRNNNNLQQTKSNLRLPDSEHRRWQDRGKNRSIRRNQDAMWMRRTRYQSVPKIDNTEKKWWRLLKWLPGLQSFKFPRRSTVPEVRALDEAGNPREELSMTMWNIRDDGEQRPM